MLKFLHIFYAKGIALFRRTRTERFGPYHTDGRLHGVDREACWNMQTHLVITGLIPGFEFIPNDAQFGIASWLRFLMWPNLV